MFTERKIEKFQQTVSALPDTPNLSAVELKRRFDACPEELRQALNGVCDDGAANKTIALGFEPKAVLVFGSMGRTYSEKSYGGTVYDGGLALPGKPVTVTTYEGETYQILETAKNGFTVYKNQYETGNGDRHPISTNDGLHYYIAFR